MRQLFSILFMVTTLAGSALAQDSVVQAPSGDRQPASGYGHGGRAEVFATGFGLFSNQVNGNGVGEQATEAGGASAGYRFHLNSSSALEGRYGFSRDSQKFSTASGVTSIPAYFSEISGSYVYSFGRSHRIQPFLEGGGGLVIFSPTNYSAGNSLYGGGGTTSVGVPRQSKGMFAYGGGADVPMSSRVSLRLEFRDVGYKTPDFRTATYHTNTFSFLYEPSIGFAYRF
jgi:hypothetical protein